MSENCCLCLCFTELYFFYWLLVFSIVIIIAVPFFFQSFSVNIACTSTQTASRIKRVWRLYIDKINKKNKKINIINSLMCWSVTLLMFIQTSTTVHELRKREPAGRIGDFGNYFNGLAKSPGVLRSSWILNECNLYCKIVKYCILSEVCTIKKSAS